jgi:hypothetical protein
MPLSIDSAVDPAPDTDADVSWALAVEADLRALDTQKAAKAGDTFTGVIGGVTPAGVGTSAAAGKFVPLDSAGQIPGLASPVPEALFWMGGF